MGEHFTAEGLNFPLASSTQLAVRWASTSSAAPAGAQVTVTRSGATNTYDVALAGDWYAHTATGLSPSVEYSFKARCSDADTWSMWSAKPLTLSTTADDAVELVLVPPAGSTLGPHNAGSASLSATSSSWSCAGQVPPAIPTGAYTLTAQRSDGKVIATLPVTITAGAGANLVVMGVGGQVDSNPQLIGGTQFTVRGEGFGSGPVALTIDNQPAGEATSSDGVFTAKLTAPGNPYSFGTFTVTATSGTVKASAQITEVGEPK